MAATPEPSADHSSTTSPEHLTLRRSYSVMVTHFKSQPDDICDTLFEDGYISPEVHTFATDRSKPQEQKAHELVDALIDKAEHDPSVYHGFISILKSEGPSTDSIIEQLEERFRAEQTALADRDCSSDEHDHSARLISTRVTKTEPNCENCKNCSATRYCLECGKLMCESCTGVHQRWNDFSSHRVVIVDEVDGDPSVLDSAPQTFRCKKHDLEAELYCETCSDLICNQCINGAHKDHTFGVVEEVFQKYREELVSSLKPFKRLLERYEQALKVLNFRDVKINGQKATSVAPIAQKEIEQLFGETERGELDQSHELSTSENDSLKSRSSRGKKLQLCQIN